MRNLIMAALVVASVLPMAAFAQCGGNRSVDFGNANLGQQLCSGGNCGGGGDAILESQISALTRQIESMTNDLDAHTTRIAMVKKKQSSGGAAASASASTALTQPNGYLTFQEEGAYAGMEAIPPLPTQECDVNALKAEIAALRAELNSGRVRQTKMYLTGNSGGASAAASASTATEAPAFEEVTITNAAPSRSSNQSACSSGGCGGGGRFRFFKGRPNRQVSFARSRSVSGTR